MPGLKIELDESAQTGCIGDKNVRTRPKKLDRHSINTYTMSGTGEFGFRNIGRNTLVHFEIEQFCS